MKKIIVILLLILFSLTLLGCKTYEDYIPLEEDYGAWDGNYIYYRNVRCKTTGEDEQLLVKEIYYKEKNYEIDSLVEYDYIDNNIYMIICFINENEESIYSFLKYDIKNKTTQHLYIDEDRVLTSFFVLDNRFVFLKIRDLYDDFYYDEYYVRYDLQTNTITSFIEYEVIKVLDDIILCKKDGITYYTKYNEFNFVEVGNLENGINKLVEVKNKKYLLNVSYKSISSNVFHKTLSIYDFETEKLHNIITYNDAKQFELINDEYIIFYETKPYEYVSSLKNMQSMKHEVLEHYLNVNNVLSKIDYEMKSINDVYIFENKNIDYSYGYIEDNKYYIVSEEVIKGNQIIQGKVKTKEYVLSLNTWKLTKYSSIKKESTPYVRNEIVVGNYTYYWESHSIAPIMSSSRVNFLYREDINTKEVKVMQFFGYVLDEIKGTRYSRLFVDAYHNYRGLEDILILDY